MFPRDLAVVTCHFNPFNYQARARNLSAFIANMRAHDLPLFLVELAFPGQSFSISSRDAILRLRGRDIMWHKERLINIVVPALPEQYTKVAWVDADVIFPDRTWYAAASRLLDEFHLIQLFEAARQVIAGEASSCEFKGVAAYIAEGKANPFWFAKSRATPGLAWAARRELLASHGLFDKIIVGGGDTYMGLASFGPKYARFDWYARQLAPRLREQWSTWSQSFSRDVLGCVGFVPIVVTQLGHGSLANRRYIDRFRILADHDFDPLADVARDDQGVWEWATPKRSLHLAVRDYFRERNEDGR